MKCHRLRQQLSLFYGTYDGVGFESPSSYVRHSVAGYNGITTIEVGKRIKLKMRSSTTYLPTCYFLNNMTSTNLPYVIFRTSLSININQYNKHKNMVNALNQYDPFTYHNTVD